MVLTGLPLHCSSASSSPVQHEQLPYPPPSLSAANESQGRFLGNCAAQPAPLRAQDSDSEEEFGPNSFLVRTGSGNIYAAAVTAATTGTLDGEFNGLPHYYCFLQASGERERGGGGRED